MFVTQYPASIIGHRIEADRERACFAFLLAIAADGHGFGPLR